MPRLPGKVMNPSARSAILAFRLRISLTTSNRVLLGARGHAQIADRATLRIARTKRPEELRGVEIVTHNIIPSPTHVVYFLLHGNDRRPTQMRYVLWYILRSFVGNADDLPSVQGG